MKTMKSLKTIGLISLSVLGISAASMTPAAAQQWRNGYQGERFTGRYDALEWQLRNAADEGRIRPQQADRLLSMWRENQPLAWRVETGRANQWERQRVMTTMSRIEQALSRSQRYTRYDRDPRYDRRY
jgi:hypothetical protein